MWIRKNKRCLFYLIMFSYLDHFSKFSSFQWDEWQNSFCWKLLGIITLFNSPNNRTNVFPPNFQLSVPFLSQKKPSVANAINSSSRASPFFSTSMTSKSPPSSLTSSSSFSSPYIRNHHHHHPHRPDQSLEGRPERAVNLFGWHQTLSKQGRSFHPSLNDLGFSLEPNDIWVICYCWGNSSMVEGRFSKWF